MRNIVILIWLFFASTCFGATYYSDYSTGFDSNTGTQSSPWKYAPGMSGWTGKAQLSNGDTVILKGGVTWSFASTTDDLWSLPAQITIQGGQQLGTPWGTGYPVLDGSTSTATRHGIYSHNKSNVTIDGIKIYNVGNSTDGSGFGIEIYGGSSVEIKNCYFDTYAVDGLAVDPQNASMSSISIHDNTFADQARIDVNAGSTYVIDGFSFYNNKIVSGRSYNAHAYHTDGIMIQGANNSVYPISNAKIYNNNFYGDWTVNNSATAAIYMSGTSNQYSTQHMQIYNNVIVSESSCPSITEFSPGAIAIYNGHHNDVKIYNNTISTDSCAGTYQVSTCIDIEGTAAGGVDTVDLKNNIISGCVNAITLHNTVNITLDYNLYYNWGTRMINGWPPTYPSTDCRTLASCQASPFYQEAHGVTGDPKFVSWPNGITGSGIWTLQSSSHAIHAGINLSSYFTTDLAGNARPSSGAWDIGAYQSLQPNAPVLH